MNYYKTYENGLKLVFTKIEGLMSVSCGILVKTGSINEDERENGISHFIEHTMFKGTESRSAFEISDGIDRIGAQINAFTSKELTCYYTKSTSEHLKESMEVLSDIFFNSVFDEKELDKERGVVIEEINMTNDTPEDVCFDLLAKSYYGDEGLGRTILGLSENIKRFSRNDILNYMDKYYTADNVVISIAGNFDFAKAEEMVTNLFAEKFKRIKSAEQYKTATTFKRNLHFYKKTEQAHISFIMNGLQVNHPKMDAFSISNYVLGGGMSSRLFQKIREEMGLCYSVYSYPSAYKDNGVLEVYAGVKTDCRDMASDAIINLIKTFKKEKITNDEFMRGKEQIKSSLIMGRESTASQMLLHGKKLIMDKKFSFEEQLEKINGITLQDVNDVIDDVYDLDNISSATVGPKKSSLKI